MNSVDATVLGLCQYRAKPFRKLTEGVTTNAWSRNVKTTAVKRHERAASYMDDDIV
ncbi:hypothetical protein [Sporosarcina phage Lietuvens]|nr:hypothetical protein [Sporosarcina phage Lietuvens]